MSTKRFGQLISCFFLFLLISNHARGEDQSRDALKNLLPASDWHEVWNWESDHRFYGPEDLFEYINGSADLYLAYGFRQLVTVNYMTTEELSVLVDIYDMGNLLNAYGVFSNYRSPGNDYADIGTEATVSDYHIRFYQGQYIIDLNASDATEMVQNFMHRLAEEIAARIQAPKEEPDILTLLPKDNLIEKTPKYISEGLLGHRFFPKGLEAQYLLDSTEVKAFIVMCDSKGDAENAFTAFSEYLKKRGDDFSNIKIDDLDVIAGKLPYHGNAITTIHEQYVFGIIDLPDTEVGNTLLKSMLDQIKRYESK